MARPSRIDQVRTRVSGRTASLRPGAPAAHRAPGAAGPAGQVAGAAAQLAGAAGTAAAVGAVLAAQSLTSLLGAARSAVGLVEDARESVRAVHRLALRADGLVTELEEPVRALVPGIRRLAAVLDDPVVEQVPDTLRQVQDDLLPVLRTLADTHERVAEMAGSTERIMTFVEDASRTLGALPGSGLLGRRRVPGRVITVEQVDRPEG